MKPGLLENIKAAAEATPATPLARCGGDSLWCIMHERKHEQGVAREAVKIISREADAAALVVDLKRNDSCRL